MKKNLLLIAIFGSTLTACDLAEDPKKALERQYFSEHQELQQVIEDIRTEGLSAVKQGAEAGTVAACVASKLDADPMGALIEVEGALQDSIDLSELLATLSNLSEQELSLESLPDLIRQGTDALTYVKHMLEQYDVNEIQQQAAELIANGQTKTKDLGQHLRSLVEQCEK
ncbi:hypothetical protein AAEU29_07630 [Pseudoalteromonas sp. SSM20]|uniref:hypothetical protein n=1 Tax=Pseudoalteromonas sp. SSM20 TaxID=3139394 RepID=UPI003BAD50F6